MATEIKIISEVATIVSFPSWPIPTIPLQAGQGSFDLKSTMPTGIPTGGVFGTIGALPPTITLTTDGVLSATAAASAGTFAAQFTYTLP